ncbi:hypothetical protein B0T17DRAFT_12712 [Bombardia bombarda]|uniref:Uncharacterized protein n=1 Tax=Bombardia bombarda TaxID=252184 RepID=A0AA39XKC2_9PEZI|nr:hypothetical protein B0T17DRAFT_12712 [Bombardia bombarda]
MKFLSILVLTAAGSVMALPRGGDDNGNGNGRNFKNATASADGNGTSAKSACRQLAHLTELTSLAANQTRLDEVTKNNATRADTIKAKAATAATQLAALQANSTLLDTCNQVFAVSAMADSCDQIKELTKLQALVANQTALDEKSKGNATRADSLKAKAAAGVTVLVELQANATLTQFCAVEQTKDDCGEMAKLQKQVDRAAANATAVDSSKFKGNSTRSAEKVQAKAEEAQTKLAALKSNATLVAECAKLGDDSATGSSASTPSGGAEAATSVSTTDSPASTSSSAAALTGAAGSLQPIGTMVSLAAAFFLGILVLRI